MIAHDRDDGELSVFEPQFRCRIVTITINPRMTRAIPAAYSLAAGSVNRDAGALTNRTVAAMNTIVIERPIQILRGRAFLGFTIIACIEMLVTANLDSNIFVPKGDTSNCTAPLSAIDLSDFSGACSNPHGVSASNEAKLSDDHRERGSLEGKGV